MKANNSIEMSHLIEHETKRHVFIKFLILVAILVAYTGYLSYEYGFATGGILALISWSFFVMCTPVADAGMLLDFPIRLLFKIRMWVTELIVWLVAIAVNIYAIFLNPQVYENSMIGNIFYGILTQPYPYWSIIILSFFGTFLSVHFADELMDYIKHHEIQKTLKHRLIFEGIIMLAIFALILAVYNILLGRLGIDITSLGA